MYACTGRHLLYTVVGGKISRFNSCEQWNKLPLPRFRQSSIVCVGFNGSGTRDAKNKGVYQHVG